MPAKKILLIPLGVIIAILIAFGAYSLGKSQSNSDNDTDSAAVDKSTTTPASKDSSSCPITLTSSESDTVGSWKTYKPTQGYSFKHPADWETTEQGDTSIILSSDTALFSFQFGTLDKDQESGFLIDARENITVDCVDTEKVSLRGQAPGGENFRRVVTQFTKNGKTYTALLTFRFVDDSTSNGLKEKYDLILKTLEFN